MSTFTLAQSRKVFRSLKPISQIVILAESLDVLTTLIGLSLFSHINEMNPLPTITGSWYTTILIKLVAVAIVVYVLERVEKWPRFVWIVPITAMLPVLWNLLIISAEMVY